MNELEPEPSESDADVVIVVVRTGGFAGLRRRWGVERPEPEAHGWIALVEQCPWDAPEPETDDTADRYVWHITARLPHERRERELPDSQMTGPWRELVDAVKVEAKKA